MYGRDTSSGVANVSKMDGIRTSVAHRAKRSAIKYMNSERDQTGEMCVLYLERGGEEGEDPDDVLMNSFSQLGLRTSATALVLSYIEERKGLRQNIFMYTRVVECDATGSGVCGEVVKQMGGQLVGGLRGGEGVGRC